MSRGIVWEGARRLRWAPLALTLLLHLLLVGGWLAAAGSKPAGGVRPAADRVVMLLFPARAAAPPKRRVASVARSPPSPRPARQSPVRPVPVPVPVPGQAAAQTPVAPAAAEVEAAVEVDELQIKPAPGPTLVIERALRDVGKIDRALRAGAPGVPAQRPDTPVARFERIMASAHIDRSKSMSMDTYRSPDGVSYTRITRAGGAVCYMGGGARPKQVNCPPPDSGWVKK
ncbi:hypothetical protein C7C56_002285 [Massilia glaciei]|uniref:Uncharacterized protein n=1 Tax=Massilia glaciei TaxID=1524097 RepID=A0A2U2I6H3_9BURK|nr:hypothetical protein C7C56_002285 [Massilia glaciei]